MSPFSVSSLPEVPVGTILSWVLRVDNSSGGEIADLPEGWMRCDGSVIPPGSIWTGKQVPNLNGERRFLRGGSDAEILTLEEDQIMEHEHNLDDPGHAHPYVDRYLDDSADSQYFGHKEVAHPYYPGVSHAVATSATTTGASVAGVSSQYRHGGENRPKNMGIIWIIRVW